MTSATDTSTAASDVPEVKVNRKARVGTVVSDKGHQTIIVAIERASPHRLYRKVIRSTKRYPVHDPENSATTGDLVRIEECRPISKTKRWRLVEVLTERAVAEVAPTALDAALVSEVQRSSARAASAEGASGTAETGAPTELGTATEQEATARAEAATPALAEDEADSAPATGGEGTAAEGTEAE